MALTQGCCITIQTARRQSLAIDPLIKEEESLASSCISVRPRKEGFSLAAAAGAAGASSLVCFGDAGRKPKNSSSIKQGHV